MASHALTTVSKGHLKRLIDQASNLKKRAARAVEKAGEIAEIGVHSLEVGAGAFSMGMLAGYNGGIPEVVGVPLDLGVALGLHAAAFSGMAGSSAKHLHGFADGALAHFATVMGTKAGMSLKSKHAGTAPAGA